MSPLMGIVAFAVVAGTITLIVGLARRRRAFILIGIPAVLLLVGWYLLASRAPDPEADFARYFGADNRTAASEIMTIKPTLMDGHFISFHISQSDFDSKIRSRFNASSATPKELLQRQQLPEGWPKWIESAPSMLEAEVDHQRVFAVYGSKERKLFASVEYAQW